MAKQLFTIGAFHKGIYNEPSHRDIPDDSFVYSSLLDQGSLGKLTVLGKFKPWHNLTMLIWTQNSFPLDIGYYDSMEGTPALEQDAVNGYGFFVTGSDYGGLVPGFEDEGDAGSGSAYDKACYQWFLGNNLGQIISKETTVEHPFTHSYNIDPEDVSFLAQWSIQEKVYDFGMVQDALQFTGVGSGDYPIWSFISTPTGYIGYDVTKKVPLVKIQRLYIDLDKRFKLAQDDDDTSYTFKVGLGSPIWSIQHPTSRWIDTSHMRTTDEPYKRNKFSSTDRDLWKLDAVDFDGDASNTHDDLVYASHRWHGNNVIKLISLGNTNIGAANQIGGTGDYVLHACSLPKTAKETTIGVGWGAAQSGTWPIHKTADDKAVNFYFTHVMEDGSETPVYIADDPNSATEQNSSIKFSNQLTSTGQGWFATDNSDNQTGDRALHLRLMVGVGGYGSDNDFDGHSSFPDTIAVYNPDITGNIQYIPTKVNPGLAYESDNTSEWVHLNDTSNHMARAKGIRMYWNHTHDYPFERYLLLEIDYEKGVRISPSLNFDEWTGKSKQTHLVTNALWEYPVGTDVEITRGMYNTNEETDFIPVIYSSGSQDSGGISSTNPGWPGVTDIIIPNPPIFETWESLNGFPANEAYADVKFKTAAMAHDRMYVGNVKVDSDNYPDRIMISAVGQHATFPRNAFLDLSASDGDEIVHLESFADRLLVFKKEKLYIWNIATPGNEMIEAMYDFRGVKYPYHATKTDFGVVLANELGAYLYDGQGVVNLFEKEGVKIIDVNHWSSHIFGNEANGFLKNSRVGYDSKEKKVLFLGNNSWRHVLFGTSADSASSDSSANRWLYAYDIVTESWVSSDEALAPWHMSDVGNVYHHDNYNNPFTVFTNMIVLPDGGAGLWATDGPYNESELSFMPFMSAPSHTLMRFHSPESYGDMLRAYAEQAWVTASGEIPDSVILNNIFDWNMNGGRNEDTPRLLWKSKEIDLGHPSQVKKLKKLYISHFTGEQAIYELDPDTGELAEGPGARALEAWNIYVYIEYIDKKGNVHKIKPSNLIGLQTRENGYFGRLEKFVGDELGDVQYFNNINQISEILLNINVKTFTIYLYEQACSANQSTYFNEDGAVWPVNGNGIHGSIYINDNNLTTTDTLTVGPNGLPKGFYINDMEVSYKPKSVR